VATAADPGISPEALVREADAAMYQAKRRGGGEASLAGTDDGLAGGPQAADHAAPPELANELRAALERAELRVLYQPLYGLRDGQQVSGFEALVRWQHPERGLIAPREFIPLAEEIGLCAAIGHFVLREALPLLARLRAARKDLTVAINLSYDQLADAELALALAAVGQAGLQPAAVCVDIPEAAVSRDPDQAIRAARVLRSAGVRVAIDDYGAGSVPLHNLRRLQPDQLKIHESIVGELDGHPPDGAIVGAVVELAHALGMQVIAEGVETDVQLTELRLLGCDGAQGYLLGRPVAAEQLEELIAGAM
jgi:EAL domain-containing protein (putative c-di-GMP-specific phosphodiesterase class I)